MIPLSGVVDSPASFLINSDPLFEGRIVESAGLGCIRLATLQHCPKDRGRKARRVRQLLPRRSPSQRQGLYRARQAPETTGRSVPRDQSGGREDWRSFGLVASPGGCGALSGRTPCGGCPVFRAGFGRNPRSARRAIRNQSRCRTGSYSCGGFGRDCWFRAEGRHARRRRSGCPRCAVGAGPRQLSGARFQRTWSRARIPST